jgi:hypothetical protein
MTTVHVPEFQLEIFRQLEQKYNDREESLSAHVNSNEDITRIYGFFADQEHYGDFIRDIKLMGSVLKGVDNCSVEDLVDLVGEEHKDFLTHVVDTIDLTLEETE